MESLSNHGVVEKKRILEIDLRNNFLTKKIAKADWSDLPYLEPFARTLFRSKAQEMLVKLV